MEDPWFPWLTPRSCEWSKFMKTTDLPIFIYTNISIIYLQLSSTQASAECDHFESMWNKFPIRGTMRCMKNSWCCSQGWTSEWSTFHGVHTVCLAYLASSGEVVRAADHSSPCFPWATQPMTLVMTWLQQLWVIFGWGRRSREIASRHVHRPRNQRSRRLGVVSQF